MSLNLDLYKQTQEVIFSRKLKKVCHLPLRFNNSNVSQVSSQNNVGLTIDNRLTFDMHLKNVSNENHRIFTEITEYRRSYQG